MIDAAAARHGMTASGLARKAALDPTSFNISKRIGKDGRPRWPSTETVARVLDATGDDLLDFIAIEDRAAFGAACLQADNRER